MSGSLSHKLRFHLDEAAALHNNTLNPPRPEKRHSDNQRCIRPLSACQVGVNLEMGGEEKDLHRVPANTELQQRGVSKKAERIACKE